MSLIYQLLNMSSGSRHEAVFATVFHETGCVRPGLRKLFSRLVKLRASGHIHAVCMCTAASNSTGWVAFLRRTLEAWFGASVYDAVFSAGDLEAYNRAAPAMPEVLPSSYKNMDMVRQRLGLPLSYPVVMVDDRCEYVVNATACISVPPYHVAVHGLEVIDRFFPRLKAFASDALVAMQIMASWREFLSCGYAETPGDPTSRFTNAAKDRALDTVKKQIGVIVSKGGDARVTVEAV